MPVPLAEIVIEESLVDRQILAKAAQKADETGKALVTCLVRDFDVDEVALVAAIKKRSRIQAIDPGKVEFDSDALRELSRDDCRRLKIVPLSIGVYGSGPRQLRLAMADPTCAVTLAEAEHLSGCSVEPAIMTLSAIEEMIETGYKEFVTEVMSRVDLPKRTPPPRSKKGKGRVVAKKPKTAPFHRVADEASVGLKLQALVGLLEAKGVLGAGELDEAVKALLKSGKSGTESDS